MPREAAAFSVDVECYAGYRGEETPRRFRLGERQIEIAEIVDSGWRPSTTHFKVQGHAGRSLHLA